MAPCLHPGLGLRLGRNRLAVFVQFTGLGAIARVFGARVFGARVFVARDFGARVFVARVFVARDFGARVFVARGFTRELNVHAEPVSFEACDLGAVVRAAVDPTAEQADNECDRQTKEKAQFAEGEDSFSIHGRTQGESSV
ncbi:MAG: hypothetical protein JKY37_09875 [Nannocystaceae bacterium]|nr:hypothetical protein [Nannocystaceae bacterium]